ncbi:hypothetical protein AMR41_19960 [Hapalosiphon sp. MRB220]|nr:hypothetical protein AMR41_19960 [Hapalosiphon sp. MRB220]
MTTGTNYIGLWHPGTGVQWWVTGWSYNDFKAKDKEYFDQGLRLTCLRVNDGKYTGIWRPGTGAQWWVTDLSYNDFKAKDKEYFNQGLRLVDIEVHDGKYTGVWRPGSGAQWWVTDLSYNDFKAKDKEHFDQGLRLTCLRVNDGKYTGIWRPGSGAQWWVTDLSYNDFKAKDKEYFDQGLRLVDIEVHDGKYTGVWRSGSGDQWWVTGYDYEMFISRDQGYLDNGLRLFKVFPYKSSCDSQCLNQVVMPTGNYNYQISGDTTVYRWPNVDSEGTERFVRLSALLFNDAPFTLPFSDTAVKRRGPWLYSPKNWHHAIDYSRDDGGTFKVLAAAPGKVIFIGWDNWSGNTMVLSHDVNGVTDAFRTVYMHLHDGPMQDCEASWSKTVPSLSEPRLSQFKSYLATTGCPLNGTRNPQAKYWGTDVHKIDHSLLGKYVAAGEHIAWAGNTAAGGCGCTSDESSWMWGGGSNTHLHIFFCRRDLTNNEWYFIDPYGIYGPPNCYPANVTDPITTPCARYPIAWKGGKPTFA